MIQYAVEVGWR